MGKVIDAVIATKPEQLSKLEAGPINIILSPNIVCLKNDKIKRTYDE